MLPVRQKPGRFSVCRPEAGIPISLYADQNGDSVTTEQYTYSSEAKG